MSFNLAWTEQYPWWRKATGYLKLTRVRKKYGKRIAAMNPLHMKGLFRKKDGYQAMLYNLQNIHQGKRCFIIGNGTGLNRIDCRLLKNEITIGSDDIYRFLAQKGLQPSYITFTNPSFCESHRKELASLRKPVKLYAIHNAYCVPVDKRTVFMNIATIKDSAPVFSTDISAVIWDIGSMAYINLQLAYHLGCNPVYLIGISGEMKEEESLQKDADVFRENPPKQTPQKHFDSGCLIPAGRYSVPDYPREKEAFKIAERMYSEDGRRIFVADVESDVDVFPKADFSTLFDENTTTSYSQRHENVMDSAISAISMKAKTEKHKKHYDWAVELCKQNKPTEAYQEIEKSLSIKSTSHALYLKGSLTKSLGKLDEAKAIFKKIVEEKDMLSVRNILGGAYFHLGEMAFRTGFLDEAKTYFENSLSAIPDHQKTKQYLRIIRMENPHVSSDAQDELLVK